VLDLSIQVEIPNTPLFRGEGSAIVREQLVSDTEFAANAIHGAVVPLTPVNQGFLRNAWGTKVEATGGPIDVLGRVFDPLAHALPQERGAHWPGAWPRRDAIEAWVRRKLGVPDNEVRSVAFLVARKLKRVGMKGHAMAYQAVNQVEGAVHARFQTGLQAIVERLGRR
jgi:hypothetical protein